MVFDDNDREKMSPFYQDDQNLSDTPGIIGGTRPPSRREFIDTLLCRNNTKIKLATFEWSYGLSLVPSKDGRSRYKGEIEWYPFIMSE